MPPPFCILNFVVLSLHTAEGDTLYNVLGKNQINDDDRED
jgi:hypothetical protein